jgi:hypothetical protein
MAVSSSSNPSFGVITLGPSAITMVAESGAPTGKVAKRGSLYVNTDASTTTGILFVNTDGDSTWLGVGRII